jgi:hypothetical protein
VVNQLYLQTSSNHSHLYKHYLQLLEPRDLSAKLLDKKQIASTDKQLQFSLDINLEGEKSAFDYFL